MDPFLLLMFSVCHALFSVHCSLGKGWPLHSLVCNVFLCFCHFHMWCLGVVLVCIDP